jgi:hypothetical protein
MRPVNDSLIGRVSAVPHWKGDQGNAAKRFDRAVHSGERSDHATDDDRQYGRAEERTPAVGDEALSPGLLHLFQRALKSDLSDPRQFHGGLLAGLLDDIAGALQVGRQMPGDRWRLLLRLRDEIMPQAELEIACTGGELSVVIRTALETSYRRLAETVPQLNAELERRSLGPNCVTVFWVGPVELRV